MADTRTKSRKAKPYHVRRITAREYDRMAAQGFFALQRVQLIDGEIIQMSPINNLHSACICLVQEALQKALGNAFWVRPQSTLDLGKYSQPDPDISVVAGTPRSQHPRRYKTALLVVEVSDTTLHIDRGRKLSLYAAPGIREY